MVPEETIQQGSGVQADPVAIALMILKELKDIKALLRPSTNQVQYTDKQKEAINKDLNKVAAILSKKTKRAN